MPGPTARRRYSLEPGHDTVDDDLSIADVEAFLETHSHRDPELVSVTFAIDDSVRDSGTTN